MLPFRPKQFDEKAGIEVVFSAGEDHWKKLLKHRESLMRFSHFPNGGSFDLSDPRCGKMKLCGKIGLSDGLPTIPAPLL